MALTGTITKKTPKFARATPAGAIAGVMLVEATAQGRMRLAPDAIAAELAVAATPRRRRRIEPGAIAGRGVVSVSPNLRRGLAASIAAAGGLDVYEAGARTLSDGTARTLSDGTARTFTVSLGTHRRRRVVPDPLAAAAGVAIAVRVIRPRRTSDGTVRTLSDASSRTLHEI